MPRRLILPDSASLATPAAGEQLFAPSAKSNAGPITNLLLQVAPKAGRALEIASGTGQHVVAFAKALPWLDWQPSEVDPARQRSINAWVADADAPNIRPVITLDATAPGWGTAQSGYDLVLTVNLLHLISEAEARVLISEAAQALCPAGQLVLYGPFLRAGETTSQGDAQFHASLKASDPEIGYKDDFDVTDWLHEAGLDLVDLVEMPANNLSFVARKPG